MKVYIDTNIVIDVLEQRQPYVQYSGDVFLMVIDGKIDGVEYTAV